jgi:putative sigma-54 modulation protein
MQISITGHHVVVTDSMRAYVHKKMDRIVRHFDQLIDVHYVLSVEKLRHRAEATLKVSGKDIHAEDMYAAIDALADKLDRLVKKRKEKTTDHHAEEGRRARH